MGNQVSTYPTSAPHRCPLCSPRLQVKGQRCDLVSMPLTQTHSASGPLITCASERLWDRCVSYGLSAWGFPGGSNSKESVCNTEDPSSVLGWEDPLEEGMATHSSILAWRIPWTDWLQSMGLQRVRHDWATKHKLFIGVLFSIPKTGNNPKVHYWGLLV